jgi:hypothetical protein
VHYKIESALDALDQALADYRASLVEYAEQGASVNMKIEKRRIQLRAAARNVMVTSNSWRNQ